MTLANAYNAYNQHNQHNAYNQHNQHGADASGAGSSTLAQALLLARDAIAPMGGVAVTKPAPPGLTALERLRRIEPQFAAAALLSELSEGVQIKASARALTVSVPGGDLLRLTRPSGKDFRDEAQLVAGYAELRAERMAEILSQTGQILPFFGAVLPLSPGWTPCVMLLTSLVQDMATAMVQRAKLGFSAPRPHVLSPDIQPMIDCPGHAAFPSGHATQAFALSGLLSALNEAKGPDPASPLDRMAARIAVNRTVAGLHYPSDSAAGAVLGTAVARWLVARATGTDVTGLALDTGKWGSDASGGSRDFHLPALCLAWQKQTCLKQQAALPVARAPLLAALWQGALREWSRRWG
ncbi:MAG: phosphatase PAP2 family protein [Paracoccus sp. (in: a-proteobacteria)]|uniref:phosphatase PAP2 family protein n=1 Tax=Paracoccus sp. TaxID=267 RepID=UPI00391D01F5